MAKAEVLHGENSEEPNAQEQQPSTVDDYNSGPHQLVESENGEADESRLCLLDTACTACMHSRRWREAYEKSLVHMLTHPLRPPPPLNQPKAQPAPILARGGLPVTQPSPLFPEHCHPLPRPPCRPQPRSICQAPKSHLRQLSATEEQAVVWKVPIFLKGHRGEVFSAEIENGNTPLLLSIAAMASLNMVLFVKDRKVKIQELQLEVDMIITRTKHLAIEVAYNPKYQSERGTTTNTRPRFISEKEDLLVYYCEEASYSILAGEQMERRHQAAANAGHASERFAC